MHIRRFGPAGGFAALAILTASACATGGSGSADDGVADVGMDRKEASLFSPEASPNPYDASQYDASQYDVSVGLDGTSNGLDGAGDSSVLDVTGGDATAGDAGDGESGVAATGLSVLYSVQDSSATSAYIGCELSVANSGSTPVDLSSLEVRYYYTDDVHLTPQININWSHVSTSSADATLTVTDTVGPLTPPAATADTYIAFDFSSSHSQLGPGESAVFSWQLQGPDPSKDVYTQTNDYSFNAGMTTLAPWDHVVLTQSGSVAWGVLP
jgi:hypothetical protein